jgi:hypothetical protein
MMYTTSTMWPSRPAYGDKLVRRADLVIVNGSDLDYCMTTFDRLAATYVNDAKALKAAQIKFRDAMDSMPECGAQDAFEYLQTSFFREATSAMSVETLEAEKERGPLFEYT